jgi:4-hydroxy-2-oxoheptanedioate aldolase
MQMRKSRVLEKLRAGKIVSSVKLNTMDPRVAELAAMSGYDVLWYCHEHVPTDWLQLENCVRAAKIYNADVVVRVERGSYSDYVRPLELDAAGIMVPHVMSADEAREVVRMTRFYPDGMRPVDGGNQDGAYCAIPLNQYMQEANRERFVAVQVEDVEPLEELEEIAQVDGVDIIFFGPGDFSQALGAPGDFSHPKIQETRARVAEVCAKYGKFAATTGGIQDIKPYADLGYQFLNVGADVVGLAQYFSGIVSAFPG